MREKSCGFLHRRGIIQPNIAREQDTAVHKSSSVDGSMAQSWGLILPRLEYGYTLASTRKL